MAIKNRSNKSVSDKGADGKSWRFPIGEYGPEGGKAVFSLAFAPQCKKVVIKGGGKDGKDLTTYPPTGELAVKMEILDPSGKSYFPRVEIGFNSAGNGGLAQIAENLESFGTAVEVAGMAWADDTTFNDALGSLKAWMAEQNGAKSEPAKNPPLAGKGKIGSREAVAAVNAA
jgi:hypothetical protein